MHINEADIVRFAEDKLDQKSRLNVEQHLSDCSFCSEQLAAVLRPLTPTDETLPALEHKAFERAVALVRRKPHHLFGIFIPRYAVAFAGILAAFVGLAYFFYPRTDDPSRFRSKEPSAPNMVLLPADGETLRSPVVFRWSKAEKSIGSHFILYRESGTVIWESPVTDTTVSLPSSVVLEAGKKYFWAVETVFPDQSKIRSTLNVFSYSPN